MRTCLMAALLALQTLLAGRASAQDLKLRDVFKQMPDSLMPYLSKNDRLDFIDFLDSNMKAEVRNQFGGTSEMTSLTDDSLSIRMSNSLRTDILLLTVDEPVDSCRQVVAMVETFLVDSIHGESRVRFYSTDWKMLSYEPRLDAVQQKRLQQVKLQNILKKDDDYVNEG